MSENRDPWAERQTAQEAETTYLERHTVNAALQQQTGMLPYVPDYGRAQLRMQCLGMALSVPDGAAPPPLAEVIERATAYWAFVRGDP